MSPANLAKVSLEDLETLISFCNFYKTKAKNLIKISQILMIDDKVPSRYHLLTALPGVGPKIANLVLDVAFGGVGAGIVVDTHVYRIGKFVACSTCYYSCNIMLC